VEAAPPEGARTKAALKTPQSKRWRVCQNPCDGGARRARGTDAVAPALRWAPERPQRGHCHQAASRARPATQPAAAMLNRFQLSFDSRGNFDTSFENCMLPGNINERIVVFANKHEGFDRHLFSKTG